MESLASPASTSDAPTTIQAGGVTSSQAETGSDVLAAGICARLPIELLIDILRRLSTSDVARLSRVSRTWYAASNDSRIWRNLSFTREKPAYMLSQERFKQLLELFKSASLGARSSHTVQAVDFGHLLGSGVEDLATELIASAHSLKHIFWSSTPGDVCSARTVAALARLCPRLETLELYTQELYWSLNAEFRDLGEEFRSVARPRVFRLTVQRRCGVLLEFGKAAALLSRATTLEFKCAERSARAQIATMMLPSTLIELFEQNPLIEKLTAHGLGEVLGATSSISAPALKSLDLLASTGSHESLTIDAPVLRELVVEGHLLSSLTAASTAALSSLTLRIVGPEVPSGEVNPDAHEEVAGIDGVMAHQGSLKLLVGRNYAEEMLERLSSKFFWPGLKHVEIEVSNAQVALLVSVMAGRCIGARGASEEQYVETIRKGKADLEHIASDAPSQMRMRHAMHPLSLADAQAMMATAYALPQPSGTPTLCSQVHWKIIEGFVPDSIIGIHPYTLDWLEQQPNVVVARIWPS